MADRVRLLVHQAERAIEEIARDWPEGLGHRPRAAREPAWAAVVRKSLIVVACLAQLVSTAAAACAACLPSDISSSSAASAAHAQLRQLLTDGPTVGAMAGAARLALDVSAPRRPVNTPAGQRAAPLPAAIWVSSYPMIAELCAGSTVAVLCLVAGFAWEALQAACSLPPHLGSVVDARGAELPVTPEQRALAVRLVRSLQSSQLLPALCDAVLWTPPPAVANSFGFLTSGTFLMVPEANPARFSMLQAAALFVVRCLSGVCQLAQDAGEAAAPGPSLLAAPQVQRMLLALLEMMVGHGEGGTQGGSGNGGCGGGGGSGGPAAAAGECAGLRYALQHQHQDATRRLHGELPYVAELVWRRRPDLRPTPVRCHARLAARMLRAACRLHRGQGWGGLPARRLSLGSDDEDEEDEAAFTPVLGVVPLLSHASLVVAALAEAPAPAERLAALLDALEAAAWCLAAVAEQGSQARAGDLLPGSLGWYEAVAALQYHLASLLEDDPVTGWAALTPELRAQVIERLSAAGLLRSLDALLRLLVAHAPPPEDGGQPWCARAASSQASILRPLLLPLLRAALAPPPAGGGGGSGGPAWEAARELGVLVTAAKLAARELCRCELGGGGRLCDVDRLQPALCYAQLLSIGLLADTGLPALLRGEAVLPYGSPARAAVVEALRLCAGASFRLRLLHLRAAARRGRDSRSARNPATTAGDRSYQLSSSLQGVSACLYSLPACADNLPPACVLALRPGLLLAELGALLHRLAPADEPDPRTQGPLRMTVASGVRTALACMAAHPQLTGAARALLAPPEGEAGAGGVEGGGGGGAPRLDAAALVVRLRGWAELEAEALECLRRAALHSAECLRAAAALLPRSDNDDPRVPLVAEGHLMAVAQMVYRTLSGQPGPEAGASGPGATAAASSQRQPGGGGAEGAGAASAAAACGDAGAGVSAPGQERGRAILRLCGNPCCTDYSGLSEAELRLQQRSGCRAVWYCGAACQKQHWRAGHKRECAQLAGG